MQQQLRPRADKFEFVILDDQLSTSSRFDRELTRMGTTGSVLRASRCALALAGKRLNSPLVVSGRNAIPETEGGRCKAPVHSSSSLYYQTLLPRPSPMQSCVIDSSSNAAAGHPRSNARSHMHLSTVSIHPYIRAHTAYVRTLQGTPEPATTTYVNLISSVLSQAAGCVVASYLLY